MIRLALPLTLLVILCAFPPVVAQDAKEENPVLAAVDEVIKEVEEIRGLKFKEPVKREIMTADDIGRIIREKMAEDVPPEKLAGMNLLLVRMGFMRPGTKLEDCFEAFLRVGAAGLYVPEKKTLYIKETYSVDGAKPIIFHELVHALEDQYFDLEKKMSGVMDDSDRALGLQGLVEGSAQHMTDKYLQKHPELLRAMMADAGKQAAEQMKLVQTTPVALFAGMAFYPYHNGPAFVSHATKDDPAKIAELFKKLPVSSEQVLHPEKYGVNGDYPHRVRISGVGVAAPKGWKMVFEDSVGELQIGFLLNEYKGGGNLAKLMRIVNGKQQVSFRGTTKEASEGWDGDWIQAWQGPNGECGLVWASQWDSDEDAKEFWTVYRESIPYKWNEMKLTPATAGFRIEGGRVLIVEGFPAESMAAIEKAAWAGMTSVADPRDKLDVKAGK